MGHFCRQSRKVGSWARNHLGWGPNWAPNMHICVAHLLGPNGPAQGCTRLGCYSVWPVRSDPRARTVYRGHVAWSKKPHLEPIWCPKHGNMCGTPIGPQWPCTRLHKVGWACVGARPSDPHHVPGACCMVQETPPRGYMVPQACMHVWHT